MLLFIKAQASSLIATLADFLTTILLVEFFNQHYISASITGALTGAVSNFIINRQWAFKEKTTSVKKQGSRYLLVWAGSILLNSLGLYIITHFFHVKYIISKILTALIVGICFNYVLQKKYVFSAK